MSADTIQIGFVVSESSHSFISLWPEVYDTPEC